jgi:hypothetical protein
MTCADYATAATVSQAAFTQIAATSITGRSHGFSAFAGTWPAQGNA